MTTRQQAKSAIDAMFDLSDAIAQQRDKYRPQAGVPKIYEVPTYEITIGDSTGFYTEENAQKFLIMMGQHTDDISVFYHDVDVTEHMAEKLVQRWADMGLLNRAHQHPFMFAHGADELIRQDALVSGGAS